MNYFERITSFILVSCLLIGCSVVTHPHFTNVDSLLNVNRGDSVDEVIKTIGFSPYDIYVQETTGYKIFTYKYKIKEREVNPDAKDFIGSEKSGSEKYIGKLYDVFFVFDSEDKLISFVTDNGRRDANPVLIDDERIINFNGESSSYDGFNDAINELDPVDENKSKKKKINKFF